MFRVMSGARNTLQNNLDFMNKLASKFCLLFLTFKSKVVRAEDLEIKCIFNVVEYSKRVQTSSAIFS